jgi:hypothetical protein
MNATGITSAALMRLVTAITAVLVTACAGTPAPDWAMNARDSTDRAVAAYLGGDTRVETVELARARKEITSTGRPDLLARVELRHCAAAVASLVFAPCAAFEPLRQDVTAGERAYADYLLASISAANIVLLPEQHRAVAAGGQDDTANAAAIEGIADPLSRLVAAGVLFSSGRAGPKVIALAVDTASAQGWRRPLLAWLNVQLKRAEAAGATEEVQRLRRRIQLVQGVAG